MQITTGGTIDTIAFKNTSPAVLIKNKPEEILKLAVKRMLPDGPLAKKQLSKLKIYKGNVHPHESQNPKIIEFSKLNKKNYLSLNFKDSKYATGRRKKSIEKVWVKKGSGIIHVNGKKMADYFQKANLQIAIYRPLTIVKRESEYDVRCSVKGGGLTGQAGAIIHGMARAIVLHEPDLKNTLKKENLTTRDSRAVERKKYGRRKARRSFQFSKR